ncbi:Ig-like domain-containing protein, partial [Pseudoalteromonas sp. Angola-22]|uniref:Ig-like domain-containing protein n=1 Tax=Pseudoalteromonas sp. Angola-22 TaxID=3025340 RepID=UPI002358C668
SVNDGAIRVKATAQDMSGNPASASDEAQYDSSVATSIVAQDLDGVINSAEQNNVQLSGSVTDIEPGQLVTVTFTDRNNQQVVVTAEVDADGNWQSSGDIESLADGEISAQISIFDAAGNEATQEVTFSTDTQSTLTLNIDKTEDGVING